MGTLTDELVSVMREWLPTIARQSEEAGREAVQTVIWLVGLASGLLALFAINSGVVASVTFGQRRALIIGLSATITCGVLQRIAYQLAEHNQRNLWLGLQGYLVGSEQLLEEPDELNEQWDRDEIVLRITRNFELDLAPLNTFNIPIDFYRKVYSNHFDGWHRYQSGRLQRLGEVIAAYLGMSEEQGKTLFNVDQSRSDGLLEVRRKASRIRWLLRAAFFLFGGTCVSFLAAFLLLGYTILP
jgi:hypothetical protein